MEYRRNGFSLIGGDPPIGSFDGAGDAIPIIGGIGTPQVAALCGKIGIGLAVGIVGTKLGTLMRLGNGLAIVIQPQLIEAVGACCHRLGLQRRFGERSRHLGSHHAAEICMQIQFHHFPFMAEGNGGLCIIGRAFLLPGDLFFRYDLSAIETDRQQRQSIHGGHQ